MVTVVPALMVSALEVQPAPPLRLLPLLVLLLVSLVLMTSFLIDFIGYVSDLDAVGAR